jgi:hypothetical protein
MSALVVLLGAGSSYDCADEKGATVDPEYRPPLVNDLFERRPTFDAILSHYPGARARADEFQSEIARGQSLEALLRREADLPQVALRRIAWQIPLYLQELLGEVSNHYIQAGSSKFETMVHAIVRSDFERVVILTVNYDLFVERAVEAVIGHRFEQASDYAWTAGTQRWGLIKLHGSANWGRALQVQPPSGGQSWLGVLERLVDLSLREPIQVLKGHHDRDRFIGDLFHYPAISLPVTGKTQFVCPKEHLAYALEAIPEATHLLVVGFSAKDDHVLKLLVPPMRSVFHIQIVCGTRDWGNETSSRLISANPHLNRRGSVYSDGFARFVAKGDLARFLQEPTLL